MRETSVPDLVELIYAAACDPVGWRPMLEALYQTLGGCGANFVAMTSHPERATVHTGVGTVNAEFERAYQGAVVLGDPYYMRGKELGLFREGVVALGQSLVPYDDYRRTPFFNEFGRSHSYFGGMSAVVAATPHSKAVVSIMAAEHKPFGEEQARTLRTLLPYFRRALHLQARLAGAMSRERGLRAALDALATGAIVVDARGGVRFANATARTVLDSADGLVLDRGELRARRSRDTVALRRLIRDVTQPGMPGAGGVVWLERENRPVQHVVVAPVPPADGESHSPSALVFVATPTGTSAPADLIRRVHRLSRVETGVAQGLLRGHSVSEVGEELGISVNTVRFHLKNLFAKTGTSRQGDLIRVLSATAQVLVRPDGA
jgi:DNA-binding CsgD family transcriptional regulator